MFAACHQNRFPSLSVLCDYGLDGRDGVNPVELFERYRTLILSNKVTESQLESAMKTNSLKKVLGIDIKSGYGYSD
jgi:hypothetical protein